MMIKKNTILAFCMGAILLVSNGIALSQTPDGETPSEETVCDTQVGAAFGLCNAYCEAMDCDSEAPQASEKACNRVLDKFEQVSGELPPCEGAAPFCGDGNLDAGEQCDDGNNINGDGCSSTCITEPPPI